MGRAGENNAHRSIVISAIVGRVLFIPVLLVAVFSVAVNASSDFYPDFLTLSKPMFSEQPDILNCRAGRLNDAQVQLALDTLNAIRVLHELAPVTLNHLTEQESNQAALMVAANGKLDHNPPASWRCFSTTGAMAMAKSLLSGGVTAPNIAFHTPAQDIIAWLTDHTALTSDSIGHRRWLLDPFIGQISYGRVSGKTVGRKVSIGSALAFNSTNVKPVTGPELIAYPFHDYPSRFFSNNALLSLSLLIDKERKPGNSSVDFSQVRIHVTNERGESVRTRKIRFDNQYFGLPNNLQFELDDIQHGVRYDIQVDAVKVRGLEKSYRYWFRIVPSSQ